MVGTALQFAFGDVRSAMLHYPYSLVALLYFTLCIVWLCLWSRTTRFMHSFSGTKACVAVLFFLVVFVLYMGLTDAPLYRSWPFAFLLLYFMAQVGARIVFEAAPLRRVYLSAFVSHIALYLLLAAAIFGYGDKQRLTISLPLEEEISTGIDADGFVQHLPFSLKLCRFSLEEYPCELVCPEDCRLEVLDTIYQAVPDSAVGYRALEHIGAMQAFRVRANYRGKVSEGWVSAGSFLFSPSELMLGDSLSVRACSPVPKSYLSELSIRDAKGRLHEALLRVNHPFRKGAWHIYQKSYDQEMGRWSRVSVVECVRDAWFPLAGVALWLFMISGVLVLFNRER